VDVISGATVTALAESRTLLETARVVGAAVGVISATAAVPGEFVVDEEPWSWARMEEEGVFGRLTVSQEDMGRTSSRGPFVDLWYTIADAPHIGRALLGESDYAHSMQLLSPGEHLVIVLGNGTESFKGSAFVRGGIFDRVRLQQGLREISFRDVDYQNLGRVRAAGAPRFREGAVFIARGGRLDPGAEYSMVFLGSRYDGRGGFSRDFREFSSTHQLPRSVYEVQRSAADSPIWVQAWRNRSVDVALLSLFLLFVIGVFSARRYTTADHKRLKRLHVGTMLFSFLFMGVYLHAQPSVTQILTLVDSVVHGMRFELFASEPLLFVSWIFIAIVSLIWGRGVFCGWVCPYGALTELLFLIGQKLGIKNYELPDKLHRPLRYLRFVLLLGLIPVFLTSPIVGEKLAEIEPFKSTFLVPAWTREWYFAAWWVLLLVVATFWYRPFCRYICPLGGGLAIFNRFRFSGPYRRNFCTNCTICAKGCEPKAIRPDGTIDAMDCLSCMECEATYRDDTTCPPLVGIERLMSKVERTKREEEKLLSLREDAKKV
jgi:NosR/NirI family nitrous oxide reductase transcriptional regulator